MKQPIFVGKNENEKKTLFFLRFFFFERLDSKEEEKFVRFVYSVENCKFTNHWWHLILIQCKLVTEPFPNGKSA